ncbi:MAG: hypothetical protein ABSH20_06075 [Tepidisphaeraceae bacterium]
MPGQTENILKKASTEKEPPVPLAESSDLVTQTDEACQPTVFGKCRFVGRIKELRRAALYLWAAPTSALGLAFLPFLRLTGGAYQVVDGVLELHGGLVRTFLRDYTLLPHGAAAMTLGHVVLGLDREALHRSRDHERVHVRQCERWGPFFIPAYLLASAWIALIPRGRDPYRDNPFEREAYDQTA